jgi:circadian clock protein KaiC
MSNGANGPEGGLAHQRCAIGVAGLDDIARGGLPRQHLYFVGGRAGTGKTTLGLQFLLAGEDKR